MPFFNPTASGFKVDESFGPEVLQPQQKQFSLFCTIDGVKLITHIALRAKFDLDLNNRLRPFYFPRREEVVGAFWRLFGQRNLHCCSRLFLKKIYLEK